MTDDAQDNTAPISAHLREFCEEHGDDDLVVYHGFDHCVIGIGEQFSNGPVLIYDREKVIDTLVKDGMTWEEAWEHFYFNIAGGWVGERTPIFVTSRYTPPDNPA